MKSAYNEKLSGLVKFAYGGGEGSNSLIWTLFYVFFLFFLTDVVKIDPATAGFIMMVGVMWDAITDPLIGVWSDNLKWKWGRRRPLLLIVALPYGVMSWLLFTDFGMGQTGTIIYFILVVIGYMTVFTLLNVPYTALAAEMTQDYDERTSLVSYRTLWSMVASIFGAALPLYLAGFFSDLVGDQKVGWSLMAAILGIGTIFPILLTWRMTRGHELFPEKTSVKWKHIKDAIMKNRPFRYVLGIWTFGIMAINVAGAAAVYFLTYRMGYSEDESSIAFLLFMCASVIWVPIIGNIAQRIEKKKALVIFMGGWALVSGVLGLMLNEGDTILLYIALALGAMGNSGIYLLGWSMIPDVIEVDEFRTGQRREGLYFGLIAFVQKLGSALAIWLIGIVMSWVGYVPGVIQSTKAMWGIRLIYAEGTAFFALLVVIICLLSPMTREKHQVLTEAIKRKKANKEYDSTVIQDLI